MQEGDADRHREVLCGPIARHRGTPKYSDDVDGCARDQAVSAPVLKPALLHALTDRCLHRGSQERQAGPYPLSGGVGSAVDLVHAAAQGEADGEDLTVVLVDVERLVVWSSEVRKHDVAQVKPLATSLVVAASTAVA